MLSYHATDVLWGISDMSGSQALLYIDTIVYYITMYLVVLPFKVMDDESAARFDAENDTVYDFGENSKLIGRRVLLVEDNEMNREIADDILSDAGLKLEMAEDGKIAVDRMKEKGPDYYDFIQ